MTSHHLRPWFGGIATGLVLTACSTDPAPSTTATPPAPPPSDSAPPTPPPPAAAHGLPTGITEIASLDPTTDDSDLTAFDAVVGTTEMIGLGETVHTSGGYHRIRTRLVQHMIEKLGFRAVALETPWADARAATRYVESCTGTPSDAARSIFGVFASKQMASLFEWMCQWNQTHPSDKVAFWGFDIQDPWAGGTLLRDFVTRAAPAKSAHVKDLEACLGVKYTSFTEAYADPAIRGVYDGTSPITPAENASCEAALKAADAWLVADRTPLAAATSEIDVRWARLAIDAIGANQKEMFFVSDPKKSFEARDAGMARALMAHRELRSAGKRVAIIAHNTHLAHAQSKIVGAYLDVRAMGQMLKEDHKAPYEAIGLLASTVKINWGKFPDPPVADGKDAAERQLYALGRPALFVDLARTTLFETGKSYDIAGEGHVPREQFRALVYLQESEAMVYAQ